LKLAHGAGGLSAAWRAPQEWVTLEKLSKFLDSCCEELKLTKRELATRSDTATYPEKPKRITKSLVLVESSGCTNCSSTKHILYGYQQFLDMSGVHRRSFVKEK